MICRVIKLEFRRCSCVSLDKSGIFGGLDRLSNIIFVNCGVAVTISVHRCDNFDVCSERIPNDPDSKECIMPDGSNRWNQCVVMRCVSCCKEVRGRIQAGENYQYTTIRLAVT